MLSLNPNLKFKIDKDDSWNDFATYEDEGEEKSSLKSVDLLKTKVPSRRDENRTGMFVNEGIDRMEVNFVTGHNKLLDSTKKYSKVWFRIVNGSEVISTQYIISSKIVTKNDSNTFISLTPCNDVEPTVESSGTGTLPEAVANTYLHADANKNVEWVEAVAQDVEWGNITGDISKQKDLQVIVDAFTTELANKIGTTQIDGVTIYWEDGVLKAKTGEIVIGTLNYKGVINDESLLPGNATQGDVWFVKKDDEEYSIMYCNVSNVTTKPNWQKVGKTTIDLTPYQKKLTAGANITITEDNVISATGELSSAKWGNISGTMSDQKDLTEALNSLETYCDDLDATKLDTVSYVELSGTKGTLTDEQRATLLSGSPTLNFIDKDGMIFKCVFYSAGSKAVYSIAGESKIHVITITLPAGTWALTTYDLQPTLTAGDGITIKNNVISATGGSGGGVSQDYVDEQDQAILATATERVDKEGTERATMDSTLSEAILKESDARSEADITLQTNIDNEIVARTEEDVKLQANIEEEATTRQAVDEKLLTAVNSKQDILTAGTNITIVDNVISASGSGSATSFISLKGTSGTVTTDQLKVLGANFANYILVIGTDDTTRRFTFVQEPFPSMDLHYVCINQNKVDLLTITQDNNKWSITDGSELAKQSDLEAVDAKLGEDENGIYVDL